MDVNEMIDLIDFWYSNAICGHFMEKFYMGPGGSMS
jgi:hypothetical protein